MPSYHRIRSHILAAQIRHQSHIEFEEERENNGVEVEKEVEKKSFSIPIDIRTNPVQRNQINNASNTPIVVPKRPSSLEVSVSLSLSSFDLVLTTNEHLLARAHFEDIDMNITPPSDSQVPYNL